MPSASTSCSCWYSPPPPLGSCSERPSRGGNLLIAQQSIPTPPIRQDLFRTAACPVTFLSHGISGGVGNWAKSGGLSYPTRESPLMRLAYDSSSSDLFREQTSRRPRWCAACAVQYPISADADGKTRRRETASPCRRDRRQRCAHPPAGSRNRARRRDRPRDAPAGRSAPCS